MPFAPRIPTGACRSSESPRYSFSFWRDLQLTAYRLRFSSNTLLLMRFRWRWCWYASPPHRRSGFTTHPQGCNDKSMILIRAPCSRCIVSSLSCIAHIPVCQCEELFRRFCNEHLALPQRCVLEDIKHIRTKLISRGRKGRHSERSTVQRSTYFISIFAASPKELRSCLLHVSTIV